MTILFWKKKPNKDAFRQRYIEKVLERFPGVTFELDDEYGVKLRGFPGHDSVDVWLERGFKEAANAPKDVESILDRWVKLLDGMASEDSKPLDLEYLVPMVRHRTWLADQQSHTDTTGDKNRKWSEQYNEELVVFYVVKDDSIRYASLARVLSSGKTLDGLRASAMQNLIRMTTGRTVHGEGGSYVVGADSSLDATLILNPEIFKDARIRISGDWLVGLPDRNTFLVCDSSIPRKVFWTTISTKRLYRDEPYSISAKLFVRGDERFEVLDNVDEDDEHPIPKLDVIDVHARKKEGGGLLCVVIATPLQSDARSMYRLATKLDSYLHYLESTEYETEFGKADPSSTTIKVDIHKDSSAKVFELFEELPEWVAKRGASLEIERIDSSDED